MVRRFLLILLLCGGSFQAATAQQAATSGIASTLDERMKIVETIRGLRFREPVRIVTIGRDELPERLQSQFEKGLPYGVSDWQTILRALFLIDDSKADALPSLLKLYEAQVLAYYDPAMRTYYAIRELPKAASAVAGAADLLEEGVAVHELTHALQDQNFDIAGRDWALRADNDANLAYHALLEGEATLVMLASFVEKMGGSFDEAVRNDALVGALAAAATSEAMGTADAPRYFTEMLKFPYLQGLNFTIAAYRRGGWKELDRVHGNPPLSTREILHPEEYFAHRFARAKFSDVPPAGIVRPLSVEHLGEFHWAFLVGADVARGWKSDRVTIAADASCNPTVLVETEWDNADVANRFHSAYTRFLDEKGVGSLSKIDGAKVRVAYGVDRKVMESFVR